MQPIELIQPMFTMTPDSLYSTPFGFNQFAATYPVAGLKL